MPITSVTSDAESLTLTVVGDYPVPVERLSGLPELRYAPPNQESAMSSACYVAMPAGAPLPRSPASPERRVAGDRGSGGSREPHGSRRKHVTATWNDLQCGMPAAAHMGFIHRMRHAHENPSSPGLAG